MMRAVPISFVIFAASLLAVTSPAPAESPTTSTAPAAPENIRRAIRDLGHPSATRRRAAIRQLAEWGPSAFPELRKAAQGEQMESALSARDLLAELESAVFLGARVHVEVSPKAIRWDEPLTLTIVADNTTGGPLRVPWPAPASQPASRPASDAAQVAAMMDVADFLVVTGPDDQTVDLRVEPIERDPAVHAAVDQRARDNPPSHQIGPGRQAQLSIPLFNRGWARFPMLTSGDYRIAFAYQPVWKDETWTRDNFGRVQAAPVRITVTHAAPPEVLRAAAAPLELRLERGGDSVQAVLASRWDLPVWVNLNLGGAAATHASVEWQLVATGQDDTEPHDVATGSTGPAFELDRVLRINPGKQVLVDSLPLEQVRRQLGELGADASARFGLQARYVQLATAGQIRDELARVGRPHQVPVHLFTGGAVSQPLEGSSLLPR